ncbi:MAG TPA: hypothetical protein VGB62_02255 [Allosphingosinicella sp.]|jgi:hypothetical protein
MRATLLLIAAAALAQPAAAAEKLGSRTAAPEQAFAGIGSGTVDAEVESQAAAAAANPLGTLANPVRVGGPEGERAYLARLRCASGASPKIGARTASGIGPYGSVTAAYALDCGAVGGASSVVLDMYHEEHVETRAPAGFTFAR